MTTPTTVQVRLQLRADTAANWTSINPVLLANELGRETDTGKIKIGNGSTAWNSLAYQAWATLPIAVNVGGTGQTTYTNGQLLIGNTTGNTLTKATLTAGSGIAITNGSGAITVAASGISDAQIAAGAEIAVSKLADGTPRQLLQTDAAGTGVEWASNIDIPGTLDVTSAATFDSSVAVTGALTKSGNNVVTVGDTGTVTSAMIANGTIVDDDISATAEIAVSKLADGAARQLLQTDAAGTGVEWANNIDVPGTLDVTGAATFDNNVVIQGDLTVNGTETIINTQTLEVEDKNIIVGKVTTPTDITADGGGITLKGTTDKTINWIDATDAWTLSEHVNIASAKEYRIAGTKVLDATSLGSGVTGSSLTSVGTIGTGVWQGTAINKTYLDNTLVSTGDTGTVTSTMIADGTIVDGDISASAAIVDTKLATISTAGKVSNSATTATDANTASAIVARDASGNFSAGTITANLSGNASTVTTNANLTGDVTSVGNATSIAAGVIVDADVNASAAIAGTKISSDFGSQTITTTGVVSAALGAAATPSLTFTGDLNTGIYSPGADQVAISTGGSGRLFVDASGRILSGLSSSSASAAAVFQGFAGSPTGQGIVQLQVGKNTAATGPNENLGSLRLGNSDANLGALISAEAESQWSSNNYPSRLTFWTTAASGSSPTERLRITSAGLVGIGTSSPTGLLTVAASAPAIDWTNSSNTAFKHTIEAVNYSSIAANNTFAFKVASGSGTQATIMTLNGAGKVGIGTTSPASTLSVGGNAPLAGAIAAVCSAGGIALSLSDNVNSSLHVRTANGGAIIGTDAGGQLRFATNGVATTDERARIDASGRLLVGTSTAYTIGSSSSWSFQTATPGIAGIRPSNDTNPCTLTLAKTRSTALGSYTIVQNNDNIGIIDFAADDGTDYATSAARIIAQVDGTPGANDMPGRLVFSTTADGASSPTERMRITSDGRVGIKETSFLGNAALAIGSSGSANNDVYLRNNGTQTLSLGFVQVSLTSKSIACTTNDRINIFSNADTSTGVYLAAGGTSWTSTSDERVKENLNPIQDGLSKVSSLRAVTGNYINDPLKKTVPFLLAQDVEQVLPEAVDSTDPDELGLSYTALIPLLVAALKESKERIETLEAKVAALEAP